MLGVKPTVAVVDHVVEKKLEAAPEVGIFTVVVPCKAQCCCIAVSQSTGARTRPWDLRWTGWRKA